MLQPPQLSATSKISFVAFSQAGNRCALGEAAGPVELWERHATSFAYRSTYRPLLEETHVDTEQGGLPFALSPEGKRLATINRDGREICVYLTSADKHIARFYGTRGRTLLLTWSPDGQLTSATSAGWVYIWDFAHAYEEFGFSLASKANGNPSVERPVTQLSWSPDGRYLAYAEEQDGMVRLYDARRKAWQETGVGRGTPGETVQALAWSPDSSRLALSIGTRVEIWSRKRSIRPVVVCAEGESAARLLSFSPDGGLLCGVGESGSALLWDALYGSRLSVPHPLRSGVTSAAVSPEDGLWLIGKEDGTAHCSDLLSVVGYALSPKAGPASVVCASCIGTDELRAHQEAGATRPIHRAEARELACERCYTYLATGDLAPTGQPLRDFFALDLGALRSALDIDAWPLGGCWIAALGLFWWIERSAPDVEARLMVVEGTRGTKGTRRPDHVVVELVIGGCSYCLDSEGVSRTPPFLQDWQRTYGLEDSRLVPLDPEVLRSAQFLYSEAQSSQITAALFEKFGPWQTAYLERFAHGRAA